MWFLTVICLIVLTSVIALLARIEQRREKDRLDKNEEFSADDFEIRE